MISSATVLGNEMLSKSQMKYKLQSVLTNKRYIHSLGVAEVSLELAKAHGEDTGVSEIAGLLHDCAKSIPNNLKLLMCREMHIPLNELMKKNPDLTHSFLGAEIAARDYGVSDPFLLDAIRFHTTGRPCMGNIEKIVFLADFFEPSRKPFAAMDEMRELAFLNLDKAMEFALCESIRYIKKRNMSVHELSYQALDYFKEVNNN